MNVQLSTEQLAKFNKDLGVLSNYDYSTTPEELKKYIQTEIQGSDSLVKNNLETIFYDNVNSYMDTSFNSLILNNMNNISTFANESMLTSEQKMKMLHDSIKNQIIRSRSNSSDHQWMMNYYRYVRFMIIFSSFVILCGQLLLYSFLRDKVSQTLFIILCSVVAIIFLGVVMLSVYRMSRRRADNWDQINFDFKPRDG